jgi:predicted ArsR family transcriptional regulator
MKLGPPLTVRQPVVLTLLRGGTTTTRTVAESLNITRQATRAHLMALRHRGLVRRGRKRSWEEVCDS